MMFLQGDEETIKKKLYKLSSPAKTNIVRYISATFSAMYTLSVNSK